MKLFCAILLFCLIHFCDSRNNSLDEEFTSNASQQSPEEPQIQNAAIGSKRCMPELDECFEITRDYFHPLFRPINLLPQHFLTIDTRFFLFTRSHPMEHVDITSENLAEIPIANDSRIVFIVHGFFDSRFYGKWMEHMKDQILLGSDRHVVIVDWSRGNGLPYTQATANTRVVGAEIAKLIRTLQETKGVSPKNCHIIGHSLGSHAAGYAGKKLKTLGRITALDPAAPYFQNMPATVRVDRTDAEFVDAIHTDSSSLKFLALGMSQAIGHVDFYPNNGMDQPGCTYETVHSILLEGLVDAARRFVSCHHQRAVDFFTYSINFKSALPVAYRCNSWRDYVDGLCGDCGQSSRDCVPLGFDAEKFKPFKNDSVSTKMFLATGDSKPFWQYQYLIQIKLRKTKNSTVKDGEGRINIIMKGTKSTYKATLRSKSGKFVHGASYAFLLRNRLPLGSVQNISFTWKSSSFLTFLSITRHKIHLEYVKIIPLNIANGMEQKQASKTYCPGDDKEVKSMEVISLISCTK